MMITLKYLNFVEFIMRFIIVTKIDSKSIYTKGIIATLIENAWWQCFKKRKLLVSRANASSTSYLPPSPSSSLSSSSSSSCSNWLLLIMIMRVPEICALNLTATTTITTTMTSTTYLMMPTYAGIVNSMKEQFVTVSESDNNNNNINNDNVIMSMSRNNEDYDDDEDESEEVYDDKDHLNYSANGMLVGSHCEFSCDKRLHHVVCNPLTNRCECEKNYPVKIGPRKGCAKAKKLGEQCFYDLTCQHNDENALCTQINHNAICSCRDGHHVVTHLKPTRRTFCTQDLATIAGDLPTLLGVSTGIFVLAGLICMVLHLFSKTKYPRTRNFADAHHAGPPVFFASDTGIPLTIQSNRPSSRSSQRSTGSIGSFTRRSSGILQKGVNVSQSRQGSRRPSLASVHSTTSSIRSYSSRRFEQELRDKELRQEMKKQLCRLQEQQQMQKLRPTIIIGDTIPYTITKQSPHILTPNSTDELLPCVEENDEFCSPQFDRKNP